MKKILKSTALTPALGFLLLSCGGNAERESMILSVPSPAMFL